MSSAERRRPWWGRVTDTLFALFDGGRGTLLTLVLLPILLLLVAWLPPLSLGERWLDRGYTVVTPAGATLQTPERTTLTLEPGVLEAPSRINFYSVSRQAFIEGTLDPLLRGAPEALPTHLILKSPLYVAALRGPAPTASRWSIALPLDSEPLELLDVYGWGGQGWQWLPHQIQGSGLPVESRPAGLPFAVALMQSQRLPPEIGATSEENGDFVSRGGATLAYVAPRLYLMQGDDAIRALFGVSPLVQQSGVPVLPVVHNQEPSGVVRSDLVDNLLINETLWQSHINQLEQLIVSREFDGVVVDYRGIDPTLGGEFSRFVDGVAERLALRGTRLVTRVPAPTARAGGYESGAYDLAALGRATHRLQIPPPDEALSLVDRRPMDAWLTDLTGQVDRYRILIELPAASYRMVEGTRLPVPFDELLALLAVAAERQGFVMGPGETLPATLVALEGAGEITLDPVLGHYRYEVEGETIHIETADTLARRLAILDEYHLGGVVVPDAAQADPRIWEVLADFRRDTLR